MQQTFIYCMVLKVRKPKGASSIWMELVCWQKGKGT